MSHNKIEGPKKSIKMLVEYKGERRKMMVDTNSVEDLQRQLISKLGISNDISRLEYFDNEFGDYVTLVDLEELPQRPRIRLVTVTESFLHFGHFANDHGWKPMGINQHNINPFY